MIYATFDSKSVYVYMRMCAVRRVAMEIETYEPIIWNFHYVLQIEVDGLCYLL